MSVEKRTQDGGGTLQMRATYVYDALGQRVQKEVWDGSTTTTRFSYEGGEVWADLNGSSSLTTRYVRGDGVDAHMAQVASGSVSWFLMDRLGSVRNTVDSSGVPNSTITYDAGGKVLSESGTPTRFGFTGQERDTETGLQRHRNRYYDPLTVHWMSEDPVPDGTNKYRYVGNNLPNFIDPLGLYAMNTGTNSITYDQVAAAGFNFAASLPAGNFADAVAAVPAGAELNEGAAEAEPMGPFQPQEPMGPPVPQEPMGPPVPQEPMGPPKPKADPNDKIALVIPFGPPKGGDAQNGGGGGNNGGIPWWNGNGPGGNQVAFMASGTTQLQLAGWIAQAGNDVVRLRELLELAQIAGYTVLAIEIQRKLDGLAPPNRSNPNGPPIPAPAPPGSHPLAPRPAMPINPVSVPRPIQPPAPVPVGQRPYVPPARPRPRPLPVSTQPQPQPQINSLPPLPVNAGAIAVDSLRDAGLLGALILMAIQPTTPADQQRIERWKQETTENAAIAKEMRRRGYTEQQIKDWLSKSNDVAGSRLRRDTNASDTLPPLPEPWAQNPPILPPGQ